MLVVFDDLLRDLFGWGLDDKLVPSTNIPAMDSDAKPTLPNLLFNVDGALTWRVRPRGQLWVSPEDV